MNSMDFVLKRIFRLGWGNNKLVTAYSEYFPDREVRWVRIGWGFFWRTSIKRLP